MVADRHGQRDGNGKEEMRSPRLLHVATNGATAAVAAAVLLSLLPLLLAITGGAEAARAATVSSGGGPSDDCYQFEFNAAAPPVQYRANRCALRRQHPTPFRRHDDAAAAFISPPAASNPVAAAEAAAACCRPAGEVAPAEASTMSSSSRPTFVASSRRGALSSVASLTIAPLLLWSSAAPPALAAAAATPPGTIISHPRIESLEPMYELREAIDILVATLNKTGVDTSTDARRKGWTRLKKRLDRFFTAPMGGDGSLAQMTERDAYERIGREYVDAIQYSAAGGEGAAQKDREARYKAMEGTLNALEELRGRLGTANAAIETATDTTGEKIIQASADIEASALKVQRSMRAWFDLVPQRGIAAVETLVQHIKSADKDRDGKLSEREMAAGLSEEERTIWERRVAKFGTGAKVERCLGFKLTETAYY